MVGVWPMHWAEELAVALLGDDVGDTPKEAIAFGADKVYAITDPLLNNTPFDAYLAAIHQVSTEHQPRIILLAKGNIGSEVAPRLASGWIPLQHRTVWISASTPRTRG